MQIIYINHIINTIIGLFNHIMRSGKLSYEELDEILSSNSALGNVSPGGHTSPKDEGMSCQSTQRPGPCSIKNFSSYDCYH